MSRSPFCIERLVARVTLFAASLHVLLLCGCDKDPQGASQPPASRLPTSDPTATGIIRGRVVFSGTPPVMTTFSNDHCQPGHSQLIHDESVIVDATGGLKNCVVYVKDLPGVKATPSPVVDQVDCRYIPHLVAISSGQKVIFKSSDQVPHNVHIMSQSSPANYGLPGPGTKVHTFKSPEFVHVRCDVHPWMSHWVAVVDTPCYAVTADDGSFEIRNVPPGARQLAIWHERYNTPEQSVDVPPNKPVEMTFTIIP